MQIQDGAQAEGIIGDNCGGNGGIDTAPVKIHQDDHDEYRGLERLLQLTCSQTSHSQ